MSFNTTPRTIGFAPSDRVKPGQQSANTVARAFAIEKAPGARELLARLRKYRGRLPADFKFDRLEANERG